MAATPAIHFNQKSEIFNDTELQEESLTLWLILEVFFNVSAAPAIFSKGNITRCFYYKLPNEILSLKISLQNVSVNHADY